MDVFEMDAASNRGIDEIRDIVERVKFSPAYGKFKVYIIDEVHMLTNEAFNALLKTLEEPPRHVLFILCTTDPDKLLYAMYIIGGVGVLIVSLAVYLKFTKEKLDK